MSHIITTSKSSLEIFSQLNDYENVFVNVPNNFAQMYWNGPHPPTLPHPRSHQLDWNETFLELRVIMGNRASSSWKHIFLIAGLCPLNLHASTEFWKPSYSPKWVPKANLTVCSSAQSQIFCILNNCIFRPNLHRTIVCITRQMACCSWTTNPLR